MELSELQRSIIESPSNRSVVIASAASGKTCILTEKVRQLLRAGVDPKQIAVITFTNMAASELRQRLGADYKDGLFVGTIHALANYMLCSGGVSTRKVLDNEDFDKLFDMIKQHPTCVQHMEWILLDEAQDSDDMQFNFIFEMIKPDYFFVVGDEKQSIYQWKNSNPRLMKQLVKKYGAQLFDMNENYRNGDTILSFAKRLIRPTGLEDNSIAMRPVYGNVIETPFSISMITNTITKDGKYGDWAILTRTNAEISQISYALERAGIPFDTFKQGDLSKEELLEIMAQDTVKVLTVHSAKGLEWSKVIVLGMKYYNSEERNVCYVAATRARELLIWMTSAAKKTNYKKRF